MVRPHRTYMTYTTYRTRKKRRARGFTLIELLIVVAIIAIIASVLFVALDPLTRFRDTRDASRWHDVTELAHAIVLDQVDNGGHYLGAIQSMTTGTVYMIGTCTGGATSSPNFACDTGVGSNSCVNLAGLVTEGYIAEVPLSPDGAGSWFPSTTGYTLQTTTTGAITVRACESENSTEIFLAR